MAEARIEFRALGSKSVVLPTELSMLLREIERKRERERGVEREREREGERAREGGERGRGLTPGSSTAACAMVLAKKRQGAGRALALAAALAGPASS